ncbi:methyltransferase [Collimonas humicola]|uniref:methyltransferase n=1 Tax=Collimonas humicola TaxID=2825886 RepID=UPI001B8D130C|nr:class I SAM-dependent methyltransferase [Collimonas humicola]
MKIDDEVLNVLSNSTSDGYQLRLPDYLNRQLYLRTNVVLEAAGGMWNRKAKAHCFSVPAADAMDQIILTGEVTVPQDFGYFPTPYPVVMKLLQRAEIHCRHRALEPSAGRGAIAYEVVKQGAYVDCIELLDNNYAELLKMHDDGNLNGGIVQGDFLAITPWRNYDRVVMNPPFAKQADIHHVLHALKFLKPIGLLVAVMSAGVSFRDNKLTTGFRELVRERGGEIEALPEGSFKASGTGVNTVIVTIPGA